MQRERSSRECWTLFKHTSAVTLLCESHERELHWHEKGAIRFIASFYLQSFMYRLGGSPKGLRRTRFHVKWRTSGQQRWGQAEAIPTVHLKADNSQCLPWPRKKGWSKNPRSNQYIWFNDLGTSLARPEKVRCNHEWGFPKETKRNCVVYSEAGGGETKPTNGHANIGAAGPASSDTILQLGFL